MLANKIPQKSNFMKLWHNLATKISMFNASIGLSQIYIKLG